MTLGRFCIVVIVLYSYVVIRREKIAYLTAISLLGNYLRTAIDYLL